MKRRLDCGTHDSDVIARCVSIGCICAVFGLHQMIKSDRAL
jgi:hypothetical protein